jgi:hypothetical protein
MGLPASWQKSDVSDKQFPSVELEDNERGRKESKQMVKTKGNE